MCVGVLLQALSAVLTATAVAGSGTVAGMLSVVVTLRTRASRAMAFCIESPVATASNDGASVE